MHQLTSQKPTMREPKKNAEVSITLQITELEINHHTISICSHLCQISTSIIFILTVCNIIQK